MNLELKIAIHIEKIIFQFIFNQLQRILENLELSVSRNFSFKNHLLTSNVFDSFDENKVLDPSISMLKKLKSHFRYKNDTFSLKVVIGLIN